MYKAVIRKSGIEVVILEPSWSDRLRELRGLDQDDQLVCQECQQPVRVRAGQVRTWHFAHKHRRNCVIGNESPQLLQARATLYRWLVSKFGAERVTVEKRLSETKLARPIDCWVSGEQNFAYWIFEAGLKPQNRESIQMALTQPNTVPHWIFLTAVLRQDENNTENIHLTTTEREFAQKTDYDTPIHPHGQSLHYLDQETEKMTTYRGLHLVHPPQVYAGKPIVHLLADMLTMQRTGEFLHPGEYDVLKMYQEEMQRLETERKQQEEEWRKRLASIAPVPRRPTEVSRTSLTFSKSSEKKTKPPFTTPPPEKFSPASTGENNPPQTTSKVVNVGNDIGTCEFCGEKTRDWWFYDGKTGMCQCRKCRREGRSK